MGLRAKCLLTESLQTDLQHAFDSSQANDHWIQGSMKLDAFTFHLVQLAQVPERANQGAERCNDLWWKRGVKFLPFIMQWLLRAKKGKVLTIHSFSLLCVCGLTHKWGWPVRESCRNLFPALLIAHSYCWTHCISGNIVYGYFSDFILPIIILIRVVTLTNNSRCYCFMHSQTWNLSKILHTQIFRLKVLHRKSA